jgi:pimeloyl-ACP methyl ester carboxylesterase
VSTSTITLSRDGTPIAYELVGTGPRLILIEPAGQFRALSAFDSLAALLAPDFTVCRYDRRGRGESGDTAPYSPEREVEDLAALAGAIGGTAFVYGYSSGALLALHAAAARIGLAGMVLMEPPLREAGETEADPLTGQLAALVAAGRNEEAVACFHSAIGVPDEMMDEIRGSSRWAAMVEIAPTLVYDCRLSDAMNYSILAAIDVPVLVLDSQGSSDDLTGSAAIAARQIPGAQHRSLPGEWHVAAPELVAPEIAAFLKPLAQAYA